MLTVTDSKTGSVLTFVGNRYISNDARNNTLSGTYHVLQNGKRTPMHEMTREQVEQTGYRAFESLADCETWKRQK